MEPSHCRICDGERTGDGQVNAIDDWFRTALVRRDTYPANVTSYVLAFGAAPLAGAGLTVLSAIDDGSSKNIVTDLLIVAEGGFSAMLATEVLEAVTLRARPYIHAMSDDAEREAEIAKTGAFHSFPAGHVVEAFGVAAAAGTVASMRQYRLAPLVWATGIMIGVATGYTRIASDRHYFTDVLAGAGIGTVIGAGVPLLFHPPVGSRSALGERTRFMATPIPGGHVIGIAGTF
jgi:membrane-associated phospholipid phosphatase